jgi:uncharacterized repeat protein (TIGR03803 family)
MSKLNWVTKVSGGLLLWAMGAVALPAQTFTTLDRLCPEGSQCMNGEAPAADLVQGADGNFYGTTVEGGSPGNGTVFKMTTSGLITALHSFDSDTDGGHPYGPLVEGTDGNCYGTTSQGGTHTTCDGGYGCGTVFKITPSGTVTTLHSFQGTGDGAYPYGQLVQGMDGDLYGTASGGGGSDNCYGGCGTVFKITPIGIFTTIHIFGGSDGGYPDGGLVEATNGDFYGTTQVGGSSGNCTMQYTFGCGTIFKITASGTFAMVRSFDGTDGQQPLSGLVQTADGSLYGTTYLGGTNVAGTVFKVTPNGALTTLHNFCSQTNCTDGAVPYAGLVQGTDGNLYGTTITGGANDKDVCMAEGFNGCGTLFEITPSGALTTLYNFCSEGGSNCTDGQSPLGGLVQSTDGEFYGTTFEGGARSSGDNGEGTIFDLAVGLVPFVETLPASGVVGATVRILGTDLTGTTGVTFNGTAAIFTVNSHSLISTTVPAGATIGTVQVVTPSATLSSNIAFHVLP